MDIRGCSSYKDLVTLVDWTEEAPSVFINFIDDPDRPGRMNCYNGDSLKYWLNQPENTFAKWIQRRAGYQMEDMGHGGMPDPKHKYVKLYTGEFLIKDDIVNKLQKGVKYPVILDAVYTSIERIGNLRGEFGIGDIHGQLPGYRVYKSRTDNPLQIEKQSEEEGIEEEGIEEENVGEDDLEQEEQGGFDIVNAEYIKAIFRLAVGDFFQIIRGPRQRISDGATEKLADLLYQASEILFNSTSEVMGLDRLIQGYRKLPDTMKLNREHEKCFDDDEGCELLVLGNLQFLNMISIYFYAPIVTENEKLFIKIYFNMKIKEVLTKAIDLLGIRRTISDEIMVRAI